MNRGVPQKMASSPTLGVQGLTLWGLFLTRLRRNKSELLQASPSKQSNQSANKPARSRKGALPSSRWYIMSNMALPLQVMLKL